jgi:aryl-alcohol dehydrogenase-like predicted oxidoreductase
VRHALTEKNFLIIDKLDEIAQTRGKTVLQVALAWIKQQPGITSPIIGVNSVEQWREMEGAVGWRLSDEEVARLNEASKWEE